MEPIKNLMEFIKLIFYFPIIATIFYNNKYETSKRVLNLVQHNTRDLIKESLT
jgi:hypothetical protein